MLTIIRNNVQSIFVKLVVVVIVVVMIFFGVDAFQNQGTNVLVDVGDLQVSLNEYQRAMDQEQQSLRQRYGADAADMEKQMNLPLQVVNRLINDAILIQAAKANGVVVTDLELAEAIRSAPYFQTDSRFDQEKYDQLLKSNSITNRMYEEDLRKNLTAMKFVQLVMSGHFVSRAYLTDLDKRGATQMEVELLTLRQEEFQTEQTPTEAQVKAFYDQHPERFSRPQTYSLNYVSLGGPAEAAKILIKEKEIERQYLHNKAQYASKDQWKVRHILFEVPQNGDESAMELVRAQAWKVKQELDKNPAAFAKLAKEHSKDPGSKDNGGDLGWQEAGRLVKPFDQAMTSLEVGKVSDPVLTQFGFHLIQVQDKKAGHQQTLEEASATIKADIAKAKMERRINGLAEKIQAKAKTDGLAQAAKAEGLALQTAEKLEPTSMIPELGIIFALYQELQDKKLGDSGLHVAGEQAILYEVSAINESQVRPFAEVAEQAKRQAAYQAGIEASQKAMAKLAEGLSAEAGFTAVAKSRNLKPQTLRFALRDRRVPDLPASPGLRKTIEKLQPGEVASFFDEGRGYVVLAKSRTEAAAPESNVIASMERRIKEEKAQRMINIMIDEYRSQLEIRYNKKLAQALDLRL